MPTKKDTTIPITRTKDYFSHAIEAVIEKLSFNSKNTELLGSMAIRSQIYASDYDLYEVVNRRTIGALAKGLQSIVKDLMKPTNYFIGDIKCGEVEEWKLLDDFTPLKDYNPTKLEERLREMLKNKIITKEEYNEVKPLMKPKTDIQYLQLKKVARFNVLRWTPREIIKGELEFRGRTITLEDAIKSAGLKKLDLIVDMNTNFTEFSIIYDMRIKGKRLEGHAINTPQALQDEIMYLGASGKYMKMLKRMFSLANYNLKYVPKDRTESIKVLETLYPLLTGDLGIMSQVSADIETLDYLVENHTSYSPDALKSEVDNFIKRLSHIYNSNEFLKKEGNIIKQINSILETKDFQVGDKLDKLKTTIQDIMNSEAHAQLRKHNLL